MRKHHIDQDRVAELVERCTREVNEGLLPSCQLAIGFKGEIVHDETIGAVSYTHLRAHET